MVNVNVNVASFFCNSNRVVRTTENSCFACNSQRSDKARWDIPLKRRPNTFSLRSLVVPELSGRWEEEGKFGTLKHLEAFLAYEA